MIVRRERLRPGLVASREPPAGVAVALPRRDPRGAAPARYAAVTTQPCRQEGPGGVIAVGKMPLGCC